jgi:tRNA(Ile)-lysidine synthase TilS/MesJ
MALNITSIQVKRCKNCLAMEDHGAGVLIGEDYICNLCKKDDSKYDEYTWEEKEKLFEDIILKEKGKNKYDGLVMMSGGKDSAYLALTLKKKYGMNIMGLVIDNGYEYYDSFINAKMVCKKLGIPIIIYQPDMIDLKKFYKYITLDPTLRRKDYGQICFYCGIYLKRVASDFALMIDAPFVFSGYNPDQISELGDAEITQKDERKKAHQRFLKNAVNGKMKKARDHVVNQDELDKLPYFEMPKVPILYYYQYINYNPLKMMEIVKKELEWEPIKRFSKNYIASGCQLATVLVHLCRKKNIPDYIQKEFSAQIRRGSVNKDHIQKLFDEFELDQSEVDEVLTTLDLDQNTILNL